MKIKLSQKLIKKIIKVFFIVIIITIIIFFIKEYLAYKIKMPYDYDLTVK